MSIVWLSIRIILYKYRRLSRNSFRSHLTGLQAKLLIRRVVRPERPGHWLATPRCYRPSHIEFLIVCCEPSRGITQCQQLEGTSLSLSPSPCLWKFYDLQSQFYDDVKPVGARYFKATRGIASLAANWTMCQLCLVFYSCAHWLISNIILFDCCQAELWSGPEGFRLALIIAKAAGGSSENPLPRCDPVAINLNSV